MVALNLLAWPVILIIFLTDARNQSGSSRYNFNFQGAGQTQRNVSLDAIRLAHNKSEKMNHVGRATTWLVSTKNI